MSAANGTIKRVAVDVALMFVSNVALYYTVKWVLDNYSSGLKKGKSKSGNALKRLGHQDLKLDEYEDAIADEVIHPDDIDVRFPDIGGLESIISSLKESVIYPLVYPELFNASNSALLTAPKGVLLYGPPGCGKTMLAKALAKESGATFINIATSSLASKWYGESNKLINALFTLARKAQPSIVFIDEIDSFLRQRSATDHEATAMMKAEFMTLWDGLTSGSDRILVLGATNRPGDIDAAILRRMPKRYPVGLPEKAQRIKILSIMLQGTNLSPEFDVLKLAENTAGMSGSDLKELCRNAAMIPVREFIRAADGRTDILETSREEGFSYRPLTLEDFEGHDTLDAAARDVPGTRSTTATAVQFDLPDDD